jgi:hypothetical protein
VRRWLESSLLACALLAAFCTGIGRVTFWPDESQWIHSSFFFEAFFNRWAVPDIWKQNYWTLTQPPVARYTIALGRLAGGYGVADLNRPWGFGVADADNIANGAMPAPGLLWWSRLPMAILATVSVLILFQLVTRAAGRVAGYMLVLLLALNPYTYGSLCRAMSEAPLLACLMLFALVADCALDLWQGAAGSQRPSSTTLRPAAASFFLMGSIAGLGAAAKLNGFAIVPAGVVLCVLAAVTHRGNLPRRVRLGFILSASALLLLGTAVVFVVVNPYLYSDPLGRTRAMFDHRLWEIQRQLSLYPETKISGAGNRIALIFRRVLESDATLSFMGARFVNLLLGAIGASVLLRQAWAWLRGNPTGRTSVVILVVAVTTATPALFTPLDWGRYYLLPVIFSSVGTAVGIAACAPPLLARARKAFAPGGVSR